MQEDDKSLSTLGMGGMLIAHQNSFIDQANQLETEGILDQVYALMANGTSMGVVAQALGVNVGRLKNILKSTTNRQQRYHIARMSHQADSSYDSLRMFKDSTFMIKEEASAAKHHMSVITAATTSLNNISEQASGPSVIVNTQINYGAGMDTPPLPNDIKQVYDDR